MELENIILSEISQSQKLKKSDALPNMWKPGKKRVIGGTLDKEGETIEDQTRWPEEDGRGEEGNSVMYMMYIHRHIKVNH